MDIVSTAKRRTMMSQIRSKNTRPEMLVRHTLHKMGFRYRLHVKGLSGKPDLVFPKHNAVIFVNGCFWHGHQCNLFRWPKSRSEFWRNKITGNMQRDTRNHNSLSNDGWRICILWECAVKGSGRQDESELFDLLGAWLTSATAELKLIGY
jgi:DNA mismatch endonuclease, patch repair protein